MKSKNDSTSLLSKDLVELKRDVSSLTDSNLKTGLKINKIELKVNELGQSFNQLEQSFTEVKREILFFKEEILGEIKETRKEYLLGSGFLRLYKNLPCSWPISFRWYWLRW